MLQSRCRPVHFFVMSTIARYPKRCVTHYWLYCSSIPLIFHQYYSDSSLQPKADLGYDFNARKSWPANLSLADSRRIIKWQTIRKTAPIHGVFRILHDFIHVCSIVSRSFHSPSLMLYIKMKSQIKIRPIKYLLIKLKGT